MVIVKYNVVEYGFNFWIINDVFFDMQVMKLMFYLWYGKCYCLCMYNVSDDIYLMYLYCYSFEIICIVGCLIGGVIKDVVMFGGYQMMEVDFIVD